MKDWEDFITKALGFLTVCAVCALLAAVFYAAVLHPDEYFIRQCAEHRSLIDCRLDAQEMFP